MAITSKGINSSKKMPYSWVSIESNNASTDEARIDGYIEDLRSKLPDQSLEPNRVGKTRGGTTGISYQVSFDNEHTATVEEWLDTVK